MRNILFIIFGLVLFIILLNSCAPNIIPIKSNNVKIKEDFALINKKDYDIAIQPQSWNDPPQNLENYFTIFYIIFRNKTKEAMPIDRDSFVLIDAQDEQYSLFDSDEVVEIMYGIDQYYDMNFLLNYDFKDKDELKEEYENRLEGIRNIKLKALQFRKIRPNAQESGYIFFEKFEYKKNSIFKILYNDDVIKFAVTG